MQLASNPGQLTSASLVPHRTRAVRPLESTTPTMQEPTTNSWRPTKTKLMSGFLRRATRWLHILPRRTRSNPPATIARSDIQADVYERVRTQPNTRYSKNAKKTHRINEKNDTCNTRLNCRASLLTRLTLAVSTLMACPYHPTHCPRLVDYTPPNTHCASDIKSTPPTSPSPYRVPTSSPEIIKFIFYSNLLFN